MKLQKAPLIIFFVILAIIAGVFLQVILSLPDVETLSYYTPSEATQLFSIDNKPLARFHEEENRRVVPLSRISPLIQKAVVAIEDERFYDHHGVDLWGILRATGKNLMYGRIVEGGSTITQQLARNLYLTRIKTIGRKIAEIILAFQIERRYTKEEILEYYLNQIYFGHNAYGIEAAADVYFGKHASELDLAEAALIAGVIEGPEIYSPYKNIKMAKARQRLVLTKMAELGEVPLEEARKAYTEELTFKPENLKKYGKLGSYFTAYVLNELIKKFGDKAVNEGGLRVYTTLDADMQAAAEEVVGRFVAEEGVKYNFSQAALVAVDPRTGYIKAMVGGADFGKSQFNRASQMKRQPGSSFKPFVYAAALEQGISPGTILHDKPKTFDVFRSRWNPTGKWAPKNFDTKFHGNVTMREALERSLNLPSIELLEKVGIPSAISMARRMGIESHLEPALSLTLGASEVSPLEITSAFGTLANHGVRVAPSAIIKIVDRGGVVLYQNEARGEQVVDANTVAVMVDIMKGVLTRGTGYKGRINRPAAAKTGTTEEFKDAWLIGFVPQLVAGVWVGNDDNAPMKGIAEVGVVPRIWKAFMEKALVAEAPLDFPAPVGLVKAEICLSSGLKPNSYCPKNRIITADFFEKDVPVTECFIHPREGASGDEEEEINREINDEENTPGDEEPPPTW
ncbi:penicillin-binding protein 1A [Candidatus Saganbacteria bacterium]|nr:penicillin-binding protein 1A [Candidatus Saganbacteria bacterium]